MLTMLYCAMADLWQCWHSLIEQSYMNDPIYVDFIAYQVATITQCYKKLWFRFVQMTITQRGKDGQTCDINLMPNCPVANCKHVYNTKLPITKQTYSWSNAEGVKLSQAVSKLISSSSPEFLVQILDPMLRVSKLWQVWREASDMSLHQAAKFTLFPTWFFRSCSFLSLVLHIWPCFQVN